ncbi:energy transducer TonB [Azonexus sp.]|uniref:energy transducer TonB n=1 Tax=Azonexus sp. TaxID=1872668 RepID=UPI0039E69D08
MSYALSRPSTTQRSSLLGIVIAAHVGIVLLILAAKTIAPQIMEMPLIVDLLPPPPIEKPPEAKPLPVAAPVPVKPQPRPQPQPKTPQPVLETTQSSAPAENAPTAPPVVEAPPPPPAPAAVTQARFDADYLRNPPPPYPPLSRRMGEEGKVILRVQVTPQGSASEVEIRTSSGSPRLDEAAQKTVRNWKFIPAKQGDTAVQSWVLVPIIFKLEQ